MTLFLALLGAVLVGDYAYYLWPEADRPWAAYIGQGAQALILFGLAMTQARKIPCPRWAFAARVASSWGCIEALQRATCGAILFGQWGSGDLCRRASSEIDPYPLAAAVLLATLIAVIWSRHGR